MMSLRSIMRYAPRQTSRVFSTAPIAVRRAALPRPVWRQASPFQLRAAFSTTRARFEVNEELAAKLNKEIELEQDNEEGSQRQSIQEFLDNSSFQLEDVPGQEEVRLTRTYNDEQISVVFSIVDFNTPDEADGTEDPAMYDEEDSVDDLPEQSQSGGANTKGAVNQGRTSGGNVRVAPEDDIAPADRDELRSEEDAQEANFPARVQVQVTRGSRGALTLDCVVQDGEMTIDNVYYFPKAEMADAKTAETDYSRRSLYTGPPFGQLDEELQVLLERYLEERGIDTTMALFIPDYIDMKEQKEYIRWLDNMKSFVE